MNGKMKVLAISLFLLVFVMPAKGEAKSEYAYQDSRVTPCAVFFDGVTSYTVEVVTRKKMVEHVLIERPTRDPEKGVLVEGQMLLKLYDDGTNGDRVPGDGIYTIQIIPEPRKITNHKGYYQWNAGDIIIIQKGAAQDPVLGYTGSKVEWHLKGSSIGVVDAEKKDGLLLYQVADNIYATDYAVFIVDKDNKLLPGFPYVKVECLDMSFIIAAAKQLYKVYPDVFDFITVMPGGTMVDPRRPHPDGGYAENVPYFKNIQQNIRGIGLTLWNDAKTYGSNGRLQGAAYHSFGDASILLHEVGHNWGIRYGYNLGLSVEANHWAGISAFNDYDVMAGYYHAINEYRRFRYHNGQLETIINLEEVDELRSGFSDLTLYLMGLLPPEEVEPVRLLKNIQIKDGEVTAKETLITINKLIDLEGPRIPAYPEAQKDFSMAFIIIVQQVPTPAEAAFFSLIAAYFGSDGPKDGDIVPFFTATGGRGTLNTRLPEVPGTLYTESSWEDFYASQEKDEKPTIEPPESQDGDKETSETVAPPEPAPPPPAAINIVSWLRGIAVVLLAGSLLLFWRKRQIHKVKRS